MSQPELNPRLVNNRIYDELGDKWYVADDDPVALLRAENRFRNPWIVEQIRSRLGGTDLRLLDIGCGGGFLTNDLAARGFRVTGIDAAEDSLNVARSRDKTGAVSYQKGDALHLPYGENTFDVVCAMDLLEHVEAPERVIQEAARVLKSGGLFFFHTFNRNFISWLVAIKFVEWFVRNTPKDMHVLRYFIKPEEMAASCENSGLEVLEMRGVVPRLGSLAAVKILFTGRVPPEFQFRLSTSLLLGYSGVARKQR